MTHCLTPLSGVKSSKSGSLGIRGQTISVVQYVIKRFKEENRIENKVRKGRPAKLTERDQRFIIRKFVKNSRLSALKVSAEFNEKFSTSISPEIVRRVLKATGLNGRSALRKFFIKANITFRWTYNGMEKKNEELNPKNLVGTVKYGGRGVLVWGCMSASGLDNDPMHTALNVRFWCLYNCPQNLKTPPQSPDLNPIEHIWRELEVRVRKHDIKTKSELKTVMTEEWMNIDAEITIKKLVKSIPKRLKAVVDAKGYPTKY
ncbi:Transposable element Tcb1 transposase [Araneus ventricosus]|uniref:Transposable element Tcb1 transposase n=1 Tax=Araneus ventricosus TaxID=182803 RepID=A0A4Y2FZ84_ARAVE|nr:Transposable element Tcb1 transposase [Araneus ventricosus]